MANQDKRISSKIVWGGAALFLVAVVLFATIANVDFGNQQTSFANSCINNLRQIDSAANQFALEHCLTNGSPVNFPGDLTPYIKLDRAGKIPGCPQGGVYHLGKIGEAPTCSLSSTITPNHILP